MGDSFREWAGEKKRKAENNMSSHHQVTMFDPAIILHTHDNCYHTGQSNENSEIKKHVERE
jgi:hypothetical protein